MSEIVFVPIACPICLHVTPVPYTRTEVALIVELRKPPKLYSPCHNFAWFADETEQAAFELIASGEAVPRMLYPKDRQPELWEEQTRIKIDSTAGEAFFSFLPMEAANKSMLRA